MTVLVLRCQQQTIFVIIQQQQLDAISLLINKMDDSFKQLEGRVWVGEDEDIQVVFNEMKEIQSVLSSLK